MGFDVLTDGNDLMTPCLELDNDGMGFTASSVNKDNNSRSYVLGSIRLHVYLGYGTSTGTLGEYYKRIEECWTSIHPSGQRYTILYPLSTCPVVWVIDEEVTIEAFQSDGKHTVAGDRRATLAQIARFMGPTWEPTWVLSAPDGPHVGPMNLAVRGRGLVQYGISVRDAS